MKTVIINADDIGMHPAIDDGVAALVAQGVVTAASVMALGKPDRHALNVMRNCGASLGLHLDFTSSLAHAQQHSDRTVATTILAAWSGRLDRQRTREAIRYQLHRYQELTGALPEFVDGHEHVHQFPVIREALFEVLAEAAPGRQICIRNTLPLCWRGGKAALIAALGAGRTLRLAQGAGYYYNTDFYGVYDLSPQADLGRQWRNWFASQRVSAALAMCHPASVARSLEPFRLREFLFLGSAHFSDLLAEFQIRPMPWSEV
ncbi:MAG TPA: ChbG/HpnK family deacetylase [Pseudoduganella sp.]